MKKLFKTVAVTGLAASALFGLAACGKEDNPNPTNTNSTQEESKTEKQTIAVLKFGTHTSLDEIEDGVKKTVEAALTANYTVKTYDCNFSASIINSTISTIKNENLAAVVAIATPVAAALVNDTYFDNIPIVFAAVSDPEAAGVYGDNVTGTSDAMQLDALIDLAKKVDSTGTKYGYIYTETEANSQSNLKKLKELAKTKGFTLVDKGIQKASDANTALQAITGQIDALIVSDDNNVASMMDTLSDTCAKAGVAMYCAADSEVKDGGMMGYSISYKALAEHTGKQVIEIVRDGKSPKNVPVKYFDQPSDLNLYYNSAFIEKTTPSLKAKLTPAILTGGTDLAE